MCTVRVGGKECTQAADFSLIDDRVDMERTGTFVNFKKQYISHC